MSTLYLTLKSKFYDMIASGEKPEEYREIKPFWEKRLMYFDIVSRNSFSSFKKPIGFKDFDTVCFARGGHFHPSIPQMVVECNGIKTGTGNPDWGAEPDKEYFVIKLGNILSSTTPSNSTTVTNTEEK